MDRAARILTSAGFIAGLALLLLNDFALKQAYPGVVTGKLSDVAGLFIFPMFFAAFWPRRSREIYLATAVVWVWWKSPWSQPAIDGWNAMPLWDVGRVVDWTDLLALAVLPLSFAHLSSRLRSRVGTGVVRKWAMPVALLAASFAFAATSYAPDVYEYDDDEQATFAIGVDGSSFAEAMDASGLWHKGMHDGSAFIEVELGCDDALLSHGLANSSEFQLRLVSYTSGCRKEDDSDGARQHFHAEVVERLRGNVAPFDRPRDFDGDRQTHDATFLLDDSLPETVQALDRLGVSHRIREGRYEVRLDQCAFILALMSEAAGGTNARLMESHNGCAKGAPANVMLTAFRSEILERIGTVVE